MPKKLVDQLDPNICKRAFFYRDSYHSGSFFLQICKLKGIYKFSKLLYTPQDLFFIYKEIYYGKNHY